MSVLKPGDGGKVEKLVQILHLINVLNFRVEEYIDPLFLMGKIGYWRVLGLKARKINTKCAEYLERKNSKGETCPFCARKDFLLSHHWHEGDSRPEIYICNSCNTTLQERKLYPIFGGMPEEYVQFLYVCWKRSELPKTKYSLYKYLLSEGIMLDLNKPYKEALKGLGSNGSHNGD